VGVCGVEVIVAIAAPANRRVETKPERAGARGLKAHTVPRRRRYGSSTKSCSPLSCRAGCGPFGTEAVCSVKCLLSIVSCP